VQFIERSAVRFERFPDARRVLTRRPHPDVEVSRRPRTAMRRERVRADDEKLTAGRGSRVRGLATSAAYWILPS
jgi:hypothetical protein